MDPFFIWLEQGALSSFIVQTDSVFVFPAILSLHAVGMSFLVGTHVAIGFRMLGIAQKVPIAAMASFVPVARIGLGLNVFSGVLLLIAYPTKALTNPLFCVKMSLVVLSLTTFSVIAKRVFSAETATAINPRVSNKMLAALLICLWASTIIAGRFLAYTYTRLTVFH
jgi:hypothetical protein